MRIRSPFARRLAACLAALALVSVTARPVLACDMGQTGQGADSAAAVSDPHAHHGVAGTTSVRDDAAVPGAPGSGAPDPGVPDCDHVVGCAVMAVSSPRQVARAATVQVEVARRAADAEVDAPAPAVEPPPPRS